ncbi:Hydroxymethylpyrimidine ABC transporter, transmembrane component [Marinobacterium lacunae]|uniref:Hydroxymethylpyrimidine ABC transporter, transmembrane component n=1 Tax=Marinobacterium lacunae TaxID=1232683 RepID=A0A081FVJ6_9GAMM|nr:ABC transporter permease [Marinobacterium lacunae]KEA62551.1 Hydroxymethylpyrimidine ABC transporter, transmembrane component [Marinobacterium lacunae]MBR9884028.1 ABC transporter permease [Oceanospirillales bacterium]
MSQLLRPVIIALGLTLLWQCIVWTTDAPRYILPGPLSVIATLIEQLPLLLRHAGVTLAEILIGLLLGVVLGLISALSLATWGGLKRWLMPVLVISQAIPVFALAPVLMLWLGYGMASKIAMATLIIYFPVTAACFDGLRQTPTAYLKLARTLGADKRTQLLQIRLPAALPAFGSGLRVAASVAPIGAVVGEWVGSSTGLGYLMLNANARMQVDLMFAALLILALIAVSLYFLIDLIARRLVPWQSDTLNSPTTGRSRSR